MADESVPDRETTVRRRLVALGLARALAIAVALVALYYVLPLDSLSQAPLVVTFLGALLILTVATAWQVRAVLVSPNPAIRAIQGVASSAPLFLLLFAATYYAMDRSRPDSFNTRDFTRTDSLYFTTTVFSTVGFGDIAPTSQIARIVVTVQMVLDLVVLGLGVRVFVGAVRLGRERQGQSPSLEAESQRRGPS
jgi:voltage-gated potassium channel